MLFDWTRLTVLRSCEPKLGLVSPCDDESGVSSKSPHGSHGLQRSTTKFGARRHLSLLSGSLTLLIEVDWSRVGPGPWVHFWTEFNSAFSAKPRIFYVWLICTSFKIRFLNFDFAPCLLIRNKTRQGPKARASRPRRTHCAREASAATPSRA